MIGGVVFKGNCVWRNVRRCVESDVAQEWVDGVPTRFAMTDQRAEDACVVVWVFTSCDDCIWADAGKLAGLDVRIGGHDIDGARVNVGGKGEEEIATAQRVVYDRVNSPGGEQGLATGVSDLKHGADAAV